MPNRMHSTDSDTEFACITKKVRRSISAWNQSSETFETHFSYVWRALHVKQEFTCSPVESHVTKCKILMNGGGTLAAFSVSTAQSLDTDSEHSTKHTPPDWLLSTLSTSKHLNVLPTLSTSKHMPTLSTSNHLNVLPTLLPTLSMSNHLNYPLKEQPPERFAYATTCLRQQSTVLPEDIKAHNFEEAPLFRTI